MIFLDEIVTNVFILEIESYSDQVWLSTQWNRINNSAEPTEVRLCEDIFLSKTRFFLFFAEDSSKDMENVSKKESTLNKLCAKVYWSCAVSTTLVKASIFSA